MTISLQRQINILAPISTLTVKIREIFSIPLTGFKTFLLMFNSENLVVNQNNILQLLISLFFALPLAICYITVGGGVYLCYIWGL